MQDFPKTIISQYATSHRLTKLITDLNEYIDPSVNLEAFYNLIWNLDTAVGYGLDVWGRIVGIGRVLTISTPDAYFGFDEAVDSAGFNQASFYSGQPTTHNYSLTDEAYRNLIYAKAAANITDCSIPAINTILRNLFPGRGNCYVTDGRNVPGIAYFGFNEAQDTAGFNQASFVDFAPALPGNMTMVYVFNFTLEPYEIAIVTNSGVLPKPTGVLASASYFPS